jgi:hypothetical protein
MSVSTKNDMQKGILEVKSKIDFMRKLCFMSSVTLAVISVSCHEKRHASSNVVISYSKEILADSRPAKTNLSFEKILKYDSITLRIHCPLPFQIFVESDKKNLSPITFDRLGDSSDYFSNWFIFSKRDNARLTFMHKNSKSVFYIDDGFLFCDIRCDIAGSPLQVHFNNTFYTKR